MSRPKGPPTLALEGHLKIPLESDEGRLGFEKELVIILCTVLGEAGAPTRV